jgi:uncharacterized membrane protein
MNITAIPQSVPPGAMPAPAAFHIHRMTVKDIWEVLVLGFNDLRHCRTDALTIAVIYPISGVFIASVIVLKGFLLPFVFPICAGFALLGPMATLWFAALSRQRERGDSSAASVFSFPRLTAIQRLSSIAILLFLAWNAVAGLIYATTLGSSAAAANSPFWVRVFTTQAGWTMMIAGCSAGAMFAVLALAIFCISFPLVLDRPVTATQAIAMSIQAMAHNPLFVFGWGAVVVVGLIAGALPALLGIVIVLPVLGHASWHIYRRMVV